MFFWGTQRPDTVIGTAGGDVLFGNGGDDSIFCYAFPQERTFGNFTKAIREDTRDEVYGGTGNDSVYGGGGGDVIFGEAGNDFILGGPDSDIMYGGTGGDRFSFGTDGGLTPRLDAGAGAQLRDYVMDFEGGVDKFDISALSNPAAPGFVFVGTGDAVPTSEQVQIGYRVEGTSTIIEGYVKPRNIPDPTYDWTQFPSFEIELKNYAGPALAATDFA
jgi:Ca2+-binding RTX toxin-like protein